MASLIEQYDTAMSSNVRKTYAKLLFSIVDVAAKDNITSTNYTNEETEIFAYGNQPRDDRRKMSNKCATCEEDYFKLDGTFVIPQELLVPERFQVETEVGYWSDELSDSSGEYVSNPTLTFNYYDPYEIDTDPGYQGTKITADYIAICFDNLLEEYASEFTVKAYSRNIVLGTPTNVLIESVSVTGNTDIFCNVPGEWTEFNILKVEITKWSKASRRTRIAEVDVGYVVEYDRNEISDLNIVEEIDINSMSLPYQTLDFTLVDTNKTFHPLNPGGLGQYLTNGQRIDVEIGVEVASGEIIYQNMGAYFLSDWQSNQLETNFSAKDLLSLYENSFFDKQTIATQDVEYLLDIVTGHFGIKYYVTSTGYNLATASGTYGTITNFRESLRQIAQANMSIIRINRNNEIYIANLGDDGDSSILLNNMQYKPQVSRETQIKDIIVYYYTFASATTTETIYDETMDFTDFANKIVFDQPYYDITVTWTDDNPAQPASFGYTKYANSVYFSWIPYTPVTPILGTLNITGEPLIVNKVPVTISVSDYGDTIEIDNPLIDSETQATNVGNWVKSNYQKVNIFDVEWQQNPTLLLNQNVDVETEYGTYTDNISTKNEIKYNGALSGRTTTQGGN